MNHPHDLELLASDHGYRVQLCPDCAIVHVEVGPVTLRLRPEALATLARVTSEASARLHLATPDEETTRIEFPLLPN